MQPEQLPPTPTTRLPYHDELGSQTLSHPPLSCFLSGTFVTETRGTNILSNPKSMSRSMCVLREDQHNNRELGAIES